MKYAYFDIETNGLLDVVDTFHCGVIRYSDRPGDESIFYLATVMLDNLRDLVNSGYTLVGHNIIRYDFPVLGKLTGHNTDILKSSCIDTLPLAWHILTERSENNQSFGLEALGEMLGIQKPEITDWENLTLDEYIHRCKEDVKITEKLYQYLSVRLLQLYPTEQELKKYTGYLNFKMDCILQQELRKIKLDVPLINQTLSEIKSLEKYKKELLESILPDIPEYSTTNPPSKPLMSNGKLGSHTKRYISAYLTPGRILTDSNTIKYVSKYKPANAGSHSQMKSFLYSLGWEPDTYKTNPKGELVPQISNEDREISESVKKLYSKEPRLENLEGIYMLSHRIGILEGYLTNMDENERIEPSIRGLTSTLRFKHRNIVNLPSVHKPYGKEIRGALKVDSMSNHLLVGCDMVAIEDMTKQHYMYYFDPEYVNTMRTPGFDPHLDLAVRAGFLTQAQADAHKAGTEDHTEQRQRAKRANYACTYGAGAPKLSSSIGISMQEAKDLHSAYWDRNKAIQQVSASSEKIRLRDNSLWVKNPISGFWIPVRSEKDIFSSLNQSSGVYIFDRFIYYVRKSGYNPVMQYHDEIVLHIPKWEYDHVKRILNEAIQKVNDEVKLNVEIKIDYKSGTNYAKIH